LKSQLKLIQLFRKKNPIFFSIEKVFANLKEGINQNGIEISTLELPFNKGLKSIVQNYFFLRSKKLNKIVHITGDTHYAALFLNKNKTILTIHDLGFLKNNNGLKKTILKKIWLDWPLQKLKYITTISETTKNAICKYNPKWEQKIQVIPNPVNPFFKKSEKEFNQHCPTILHLGITPNKNLERTIAATANINCKLIIVGTPSNEVLDLLKHSKTNVEIKVNLTEEELYDVYKKSDIVSFCSLLEGFGLPIIEAQAIGRIVITSNIEPMLSVAGEAAFYADPYNIESITASFNEAIHNKEKRANLIQKGFENVKQYNAKHIAKQYADLYKKVAAACAD
jgi:glycosyltransferase involved in cell wall biosynthesis